MNQCYSITPYRKMNYLHTQVLQQTPKVIHYVTATHAFWSEAQHTFMTQFSSAFFPTACVHIHLYAAYLLILCHSSTAYFCIHLNGSCYVEWGVLAGFGYLFLQLLQVLSICFVYFIFVTLQHFWNKQFYDFV